MSNDDYEKAILEQAQYSKDNIWVNPKKRTVDYKPTLVKKANPTLVKTQAEWATENTTNGMCGYFSSGNGTTTFRVPNLDKAFLRPDSRSIASFEGDAIRNITGSFALPYAVPEGAIYEKSYGGRSIAFDGTANYYGVLGFDASRVVPTANENRPKNIAVLPLIVAK